MIINTINGKDPATVSKKEALQYCYDNHSRYIQKWGDEREYQCLLTILESDTISPAELDEYGMCDQDLGLEE